MIFEPDDISCLGYQNVYDETVCMMSARIKADDIRTNAAEWRKKPAAKKSHAESALRSYHRRKNAKRAQEAAELHP